MMPKSLVVLAEKPAFAHRFAPHLRNHWPHAAIVLLHTCSLGPMRFRYPRGLAWADYPTLAEPSYSLAADHAWTPLQIAPDGAVAPLPAWSGPECLRALREADDVVYLCDPDPTGAMAFYLTVEAVRGAGEGGRDWPAFALQAWDERSLAETARQPKRFASHLQPLIQAGLVKRYFDFNFNVNALAIFGRVLRDGGVDTRTVTVALSKYGLQALYDLRRQAQPLPADALLWRWARWPGTGKYPSAPRGLGSAMSRGLLLEQLQAAGLIGPDPQLALGAAGVALLARLHPDCEDPDLPFRLDAWQRAGLAAAQPAMDRYLRTVFGKQKRFMAA